MTTHDHFTESTHSAAEVLPPTTESDPLSERAETLVDSGGATEPGTSGAVVDTGGTTSAPETSLQRALFADSQLAGLRARWDSIQAGFVDDPKDCVHKADGLVADVVDQLTAGFTEARSRLEAHWARGEEASTEDLRMTLKGYRDFFERLLAV